MTGADAKRDARFMRRALDLAERARGLTSPNPMVGAVVVAGDEVVGEGYHRAAGQPHAEVEALDAAGERSRGATLYVTLEPCAHHGRTPPCAPRVIASRVARVVVAIEDPNPLVGGRGLATLAAAGIPVTPGVLAGDAARQNRAFLHSTRVGRPLVTLKGAITLDGKIADAEGESRWITGETARHHAHRLRAESDAIVVGVETVLRDDPQLTVRLDQPWPREPWRVVLDSLARTPAGARFIDAGSPSRVVIAVGADAPVDRIQRLQTRDVTVIRCPGAGVALSPGPDASGVPVDHARDHLREHRRVDLATLLAELHAREVRAVLVEGGGEVHAAFLHAGLVDRVTLFVAPSLLGGQAAPSLIGGPGRPLKDRVRLGPFTTTPLGDDLLIEADVLRGGA